jgi:cardiolipin synthase
MPSDFRFEWRAGNGFCLLIDGDQFFPAMLSAIENSRLSVLMEMYLFESGQIATRFIAALADAATRGVKVQVLIDGFGARALTQADRSRMTKSGIELSIHNPLRYGRLRRNLFRTHRKLLIIDGECAFVGGAGITDVFDPQVAAPRHWHDTMVEIHGPVITDWNSVFTKNWQRWSSTTAAVTTPQTDARGNMAARVALSRGARPNEIRRALLNQSRAARRRIWIATAYFVPSRKLRRRLCRAARAGIDVRILLPGPWTDHPAVRHVGRRFYGHLLGSGVRIFEYQPRFQHAKVVLCDNWVSVGSSNIDRWNFRWNLEANQEVSDPAFANQAELMFATDFGQSCEIQPNEWHQRPWRDRLREYWWSLVARWVDRHVR